MGDECVLDESEREDFDKAKARGKRATKEERRGEGDEEVVRQGGMGNKNTVKVCEVHL